MEFSIYETRSMPELDTAFTKDEHIEPPFDFDSMISTPSFLNANPAWTICHGTDQGSSSNIKQQWVIANDCSDDCDRYKIE